MTTKMFTSIKVMDHILVILEYIAMISSIVMATVIHLTSLKMHKEFMKLLN